MSHSIIMYFFLILLAVGVGISSTTFATSEASSPLVIRVPKPIAQEDLLYAYFSDLLKKALVKGADGRPIPQLTSDIGMEQGRMTHELIRGELIDINWMAPDDIRTQHLRLIPIPLDRGLFGYRRFIIHKDRATEFDQIKTLDDLRHHIACQGLDWPDTRIMKASGLQVRETPGLEGIFKQIAAGRCDYFPRGFIEPESELLPRANTYPMLIIYDKIMLHYPYGIFFFVNKKNETLAKWIETGLQRMIDSGEFMTYMRQNPLTSQYFPLKKYSRILVVNNPLMIKSLDYQNPRYWFIDKDFQ